jgi:hypothetical protein
MVAVLEALIGLFLMLAAAAWLRAASVRLPKIAQDTTSTETEALPDALHRQAKWNRYAALCAGLAALAQVVELVAIHADVALGPLQ